MPVSFVSKLKEASDVFTFRDFILLPGRSEVEPRDIDLSTKLSRNLKLSIPVVSSPMDTVTEWKMALELAKAGGAGVIHRNLAIDDQVDQIRRVKEAKAEARSIDSKGKPLVGAAISPMDASRCAAVDKVADFLVSDVAHFHNSNVMKAAAKVIPSLSKDFIVGNVGTNKAVKEIVSELPRVDGFRAGIGSGSVCITSDLTKVGAPTLYAVAEVTTALDQLNLDIPVIADGGIRSPGDASLALASGASCVMLGSVLAGSEESPTKAVVVGRKRMKIHRGMASAAARKVRFALDRYSVPSKGLEEGVEAYVPYSGKVSEVIERFCDGLRASFGYSGASDIRDLWKTASFGLVTQQGSTEMGVHSLLRKTGG